MNLISTLKMTALSTALLLVGCSSSTTTSSTKSIPSVSSNAVYSKPRTLENFNDYVQFLKGKAAAEGVSASVLNAQNNIQYMQKAVDLDRAQAGRSKRNSDQPQLPNPNGTTNYLNKVLTQNKSGYCRRALLGSPSAITTSKPTLWCSTGIYPCLMGYGK